jgi:desulfoferrodoxin-like iron-binding protein
MTVQNVGEVYKCLICGNEVKVLFAGGGILSCCGQEMQKNEDEQHVDMSRRLPDSGM